VPGDLRDEINEGMVHASPGFVPGPGDELTMRTLPVFFDVLALLLGAGVTTDGYRPGLAEVVPVAWRRDRGGAVTWHG
jgi:hypothetical protein